MDPETTRKLEREVRKLKNIYDANGPEVREIVGAATKIVKNHIRNNPSDSNARTFLNFVRKNDGHRYTGGGKWQWWQVLLIVLFASYILRVEATKPEDQPWYEAPFISESRFQEQSSRGRVWAFLYSLRDIIMSPVLTLVSILDTVMTLPFLLVDVPFYGHHKYYEKSGEYDPFVKKQYFRRLWKNRQASKNAVPLSINPDLGS